LRTYAAEILMNVCPPKEKIGLVKVTMLTLNTCLDYDASKYFLKLASPENEHFMKELTASVLPKQVENELLSWSNEVKGQINALQLLSNILVDDDEESENEMKDQNIDSISVPLEIIKLYNDNNICNKILPKCGFMDISIAKFYELRMIKNYLDQFSGIQSRALSCLNNIVLCFPVQALGDLVGLCKVMFDLCRQAFSSDIVYHFPPVSLVEIQNLITTILYSILRKSNDIVLEMWQVEAIFKLLTHTNEEIRTNGVGLLGCIAKSAIAPQVIQDIGVALLKALEDPSGWVSTEAVDIIFAVFDDYYDEIVTNLKMLEKLQQYYHFITQKMKEDKGKMDALLVDRLDEAMLNIPQFIEYKQSQKK